MPNLEYYLQSVSDHVLDRSIRFPSAELCRLDFYGNGGTLYPETLYLAAAEDAAALMEHQMLQRMTVFVSCENPEPLFLPCGNVVQVQLPITQLYARLNDALFRAQQQRRIDDIFYMAKTSAYTANKLIRTLSEMLDIGVFILNSANQLINGSFSMTANNWVAQELAGNGFLSHRSLEALLQSETPQSGEMANFFYTGQNSRLNGMNLLLCYHRGRLFEPETLCVKLAAFIQAERMRNKEIAPFFLVNETLNKILNGTVTDVPFITSFFSTQSDDKHCYRLIVIDAGGVAKCNSWYEWAIGLLDRAFTNVLSTVMNELVYAVVVLPAGKNTRVALRRPVWSALGYQSGWDDDRIIEELTANDSYACFSTPVFTIRNIPILAKLMPEVLSINRKMEAPHCPRILEYERCTPELVTKHCLDSFFNEFGPEALRMITYPEIVTLIRYDILNHTDLCRVLYTYLNCGESAKAAKLLFMHRNTVYNKLTRIEQITGVSIDDLEKRSCYLSALRIYFYCTQYLELDAYQLFMPRAEND